MVLQTRCTYIELGTLLSGSRKRVVRPCCCAPLKSAHRSRIYDVTLAYQNREPPKGVRQTKRLLINTLLTEWGARHHALCLLLRIGPRRRARFGRRDDRYAVVCRAGRAYRCGLDRIAERRTLRQITRHFLLKLREDLNSLVELSSACEANSTDIMRVNI